MTGEMDGNIVRIGQGAVGALLCVRGEKTEGGRPGGKRCGLAVLVLVLVGLGVITDMQRRSST